MIAIVSLSTWMTVGRLVANHLWQSTLFAAAVALLTLAFRDNRAQVRNSLWLAASIKFLVPFAGLIAIGNHFAWHQAALHLQNSAALVIEPWTPMSQPFGHFASAAPPSLISHNVTLLLPFFFCAIWLCGSAAILFTWSKNWRRVAADVRAASPVSQGPELSALRRLESAAGITKPLLLVSSETSLEPGVFGIANPVLLWPRSLAGRLTNAHIEMILAHELSHVRRRDNLAAAVHMLVEALFWFHPLVWWLGARMVAERERACDEDVLRMGGQPQLYAESVLKVCEFYLESPLACISGVTGSNLKKRMVRIMNNRVGKTLNGWKRLALITAGVAALVIPLVVGVLTAPKVLAQSAGLPPWQAAAGGKVSFDAASVKPDQQRGRPTSNVPMMGDAYAPTAGLFSATNTPLMNYMRFAFKDIKLVYQTGSDLSGAPGWVRSDQYDIEARTQANPTKDQLRLMVQSVLADRFKLAFHYETRQLPAYSLELVNEGKPGAGLTPAYEPCSTTPDDVKAIDAAPQLPPPAPSAAAAAQIPLIPCGVLVPVPASAPGRFHVAGRKVTLQLLAQILPNPVSGVDRPVLDRTGLSGIFDVNFEWAPRLSGPPPPGFTPDPSGPTFVDSLQNQLGLKLVPQTTPVDVLVIDHVEEPSPN